MAKSEDHHWIVIALVATMLLGVSLGVNIFAIKNGGPFRSDCDATSTTGGE